MAWLARMQAPWGVAVSSAFISNEDGTLPVNVYLSEFEGMQVRSMALEFQSHLGVINTLLDTTIFFSFKGSHYFLNPGLWAMEREGTRPRRAPAIVPQIPLKLNVLQLTSHNLKDYFKRLRRVPPAPCDSLVIACDTTM